MKWWPFSAKKTSCDKPVCLHDWIKDKNKKSNHVVIIYKNGERAWRDAVQFDITSESTRSILIENNNFARLSSDATTIVRLVPTETFDGICRACDEISLGWTKIVESTQELIAELIKEHGEAMSRLEKYRTIMKKAK